MEEPTERACPRAVAFRVMLGRLAAARRNLRSAHGRAHRRSTRCLTAGDGQGVAARRT
uniref:Uncharacterized protein n=1 Tax=Arundo donax TaxID=35708 RepID=A0A0A8ZPB1_ARUDO